MGQSHSHRQGLASSDDRISLFISCNDSITSLASDHRCEDILTRHYPSDHRYFKSCRKLSKLKKSFSECFRSKFSQLQEVEDTEVRPHNEIIEAHQSNSEMSKTESTESRVRRFSDSSTIANQSLPRDIQEIHYQLTELKKLLSRPDFLYEQQVDKRDKFCQTDKVEIDVDYLRQKDCLIANLTDQLNHIRINLDERTRMSESLAKELTILRTQQSRRAIDTESKVLDPFIGLLKSIRHGQQLNNSDLDKFDEGLNLLVSLSNSHRSQADKTNVAIINPCLQTISEISKEDPFLLTQTTDSQHVEEPFNPFLIGLKDPLERCETKMVSFLGKSSIPYLSIIPLSSSKVTLANVKEYTNSMLSKDGNFRYFFKTINPDFGQAKEEIVRDQDSVPLIDGKVVVFIQQ